MTNQTAKNGEDTVDIKENAADPKKRRSWQSKIISWSDLDQHLNDLEDDGWEVEKIIEQKSFTEDQMEDYVLVVAKNKNTYKTKRFYLDVRW